MGKRDTTKFSNCSVKVTFVETKYDSDTNPLFSKVKINFLYKGMNRNGSYISKRVAEKMGAAISYTPIIGEFLKEKEDFGTHGGKLTITSEDVIYEETTVPYGVVGAADNLWWEDVEDDDGNVQSYLTTWGYLWTKRYPDAEVVLSDNNWQSMELDNDSVKGRWIQKKDSEDFYFKIDEALISAFCILGPDVRPAFERSQVKSFSLAENMGSSFKEEFEEMKEDFKTFLFTLGEKEQTDTDNLNNDLEGGTDSMLFKLNIENPSSLFSSLNPEDIATKIIVNETDNTVTYFDLEDGKFYARQFTMNEEEEIVWAEEEPVVYEYGQLPNAELEQSNAELTEDVAILKNAEIDFEAQIETKDGSIVELNKTVETLNGTIETLNTSIGEYEEYKKEKVAEEKESLIAGFAEKLSEEVIESIEKEINNFTLEEIEAKLIRAFYEENKGDDIDNSKFTHNNKPHKSSNTPDWFKAVKTVVNKNEEK